MKNPVIQLILRSRSLPIHYRYLLIIKYLRITSPVAKTDLWNELNTDWPIPADFYVEFDETMVARATEKKLKAIHSSITSISLGDKSVSTIIDLSTIDHIEDPFPALQEYHRILKPGRKSGCLLVCWTGTRPPERMSVWHGWQYYFPEEDLVGKIYQAGFYIHDQGEFDGLGDDTSSLKLYYLRKHSQLPFLHNMLQKLFFRRELLQNTGETGGQRKKMNFKILAVFSPELLFHRSLFNENIRDQRIDKHGLHFSSVNDDPWILLPETETSGPHLIIEIAITVAEATILQAFYLESSPDQYNEHHSVHVHLAAGRQIACLFIPGNDFFGRIRIDPGCYSGDYSIHSIRFSK